MYTPVAKRTFVEMPYEKCNSVVFNSKRAQLKVLKSRVSALRSEIKSLESKCNCLMYVYKKSNNKQYYKCTYCGEVSIKPEAIESK